MLEVESSLLDLMAGSSALTGWGSFPLPHLSATRLLSKEKIDFGATRMKYLTSNTSSESCVVIVKVNGML
jgi:hypothetical protein